MAGGGQGSSTRRVFDPKGLRPEGSSTRRVFDPKDLLQAPLAAVGSRPSPPVKHFHREAHFTLHISPILSRQFFRLQACQPAYCQLQNPQNNWLQSCTSTKHHHYHCQYHVPPATSQTANTPLPRLRDPATPVPRTTATSHAPVALPLPLPAPVPRTTDHGYLPKPHPYPRELA